MCEADLQQLFIGILRAELTETEPSQNLIDCIDAYSISKLFVMAKKHDLVHIVSVYLDRVGLLKEDEISKEFRKKAITSVYRIEYMKYAFQRTLLNDDSSDNDIRFTYIDNYVKVNLISFKKRIKLFKEPIQ